jgi:hypothetical protein
MPLLGILAAVEQRQPQLQRDILDPRQPIVTDGDAVLQAVQAIAVAEAGRKKPIDSFPERSSNRNTAKPTFRPLQIKRPTDSILCYNTNALWHNRCS